MHKTHFGILFLSLLVLGTPFVNADDVNADEPRTLLLIHHVVFHGNMERPGDTFYMDMLVTNVGNETAHNVTGGFYGIAHDWSVEPEIPPTYGDLAPTETISLHYAITRGNYPNEFGFFACADNASCADSSHVYVPVHPFVMGALVLTMAGGYILSRRAHHY